MTAEELINDLIPALREEDRADYALGLMEEFRVNELPVVASQRYKGVLPETAISALMDESAPVGQLPLKAADVAVDGGQHFYDALQLAYEHELSLIAVLDAEKNYQGVVSVKDTAKALAKSFANQETGSIFILSMEYRHYSLAELSRLVESNGSKVLAVTVENDDSDALLVKVTVKVNTRDLTRILATLERYDYQVIARFQDESVPDYEAERIALLLRYLDI